MIELTPTRHAELLRAEERLKWLDEQPHYTLKRMAYSAIWQHKLETPKGEWKGPTVAAVVEQAMQAAEAGGAHEKEASGGRN